MTGEARRQTVQFLLGGKSLASEIGQSAAWPDVLRLCVEWNMASLFFKRVQASGARLPESCAEWASKLTIAALFQTGKSLKSGLDALDLLEARSIPCAGFKGVASIAYLYGTESGERSLRDVDILVQPRDAKRSIQELLTHGYRLSMESTLDDYMDFVRRSPGSAGNEAVSLFNEKGGGVDLHWRLGSASQLPLVREAQRKNILNREVAVVSPRHCIILTAHHALRNNFVADKMVRDLLDFEGWREGFHQKLDGAEVLALASGVNLAAALLALERIASAYGGRAAGWLDPAAKTEDRRRAQDLVDLFSYQLEFGAINRDLVYLASPSSLLQIGGAAVAGWTRFRNSMKHMDESVGAPETLVERLRKLIRAVPHFPMKRWRQLRTLAAAKRLMAMPACASRVATGDDAAQV